MPEIVPINVTARGEGVEYRPLGGEPLVVRATRSGIAHFRNGGGNPVTLTVIADGPFGPAPYEIEIPGGATRFVALSGRLVKPDSGGMIEFVPTGDLDDADVAFLDRDILDRA
jgi:hypothetical protein